ncbi:MAG TPA: M90 family metallopeptidase [Burkholderiaceae bacterium]|nr:M90 family metallopeptidase [Burkholderiaceae bacterium]
MLRGLFGRAPRKPVAVPDALWQAALAGLPFLGGLTIDELQRLRSLAAAFLAEKQMAGAGGLQLNAEMQVNVAAQACLPILELGLEWYRGWSGIVVYPGEFLVPRSITDESGVVHEYTEPITGEAWEGGPVLLSWDDALKTRSESGIAYSVVIHEFTHKLDLLNGAADGVPAFSPTLHPQLRAEAWRAALEEAYQSFVAELDLVENELPFDVDPDSESADRYYAHLPLDAYAGQDEGEFFAVSSEAFFVDPARLQAAFPLWYDLLTRFFRQEPLRR